MLGTELGTCGEQAWWEGPTAGTEPGQNWDGAGTGRAGVAPFLV